MFNQLKLVSMSNHFAATIRTGHRLANKSDIVVDDVIDRSDIRLFNVGLLTLSINVVKSILGITIPPFVID